LLETLIVDEESLRQAELSARKAFAVRFHFYDQFLASFQKKQTVKRASVLAACLLVVFLLGQFFVNTYQKSSLQGKRFEWSAFMATLSPEARAVYAGFDQMLLERFNRTGDISDYRKVSTIEAGREMWGDGP